MTVRVDAIVVGAGVTGGIVGAELAKAGAKVLCLDKGPHFSEDDFRFKHDEIRYYSRSAIVPKMATDPLTWRPNDRHSAKILPWAVGPLAADEPLHLPPSIGTGGGSIHWGGASWRLREADFRMRSAIIERFGESGIPENTSIVDWPISYDDLEPYYDRSEWELGISGQAGNVNGEIIAGGNPFEAPRRRDFPMPPLKRGAADHYFAEAAKSLGYHPFPQPAADRVHRRLRGGPLGLHVLRVLPRLPVPRERQDLDAQHVDPGGPGHRQPRDPPVLAGHPRPAQ